MTARNDSIESTFVHSKREASLERNIRNAEVSAQLYNSFNPKQ